jgi:hypothetical protein
MSDLKFNCDQCGQPIVVAATDTGREIDCPGCEASLIIPKSAVPTAEAASGGLKLAADNAAGPIDLETAPQTEASKSSKLRDPEKKPNPAAEAVAAPPAAGGPSPASESTVGAGQVAVLTPRLKLAVVRAARDRISDPAHWMPGLDANGKYTYAAKQEGEVRVPVDIASKEATHYSLIGAVLAAFRDQSVTTTAVGRSDFLDQAIPTAIRQVLGTETVETGRQPSAKAEVDPKLLAISHEQCLEVLRRLAEDYAASLGQGSDGALLEGWETQGVTVEELLTRLAKGETITGGEVLRGVNRALKELDRRVTKLEGPASSQAESSGTR